MLKSPVVLLAFADADKDAPLDLKTESTALKDALLLAEHEGLVNVEREESVTLDELEKRLHNYYDDLVIFHYAGHANSKELLFEEGTVTGRGIARLLGQAPHLQVVFLNACETREQAELFLDQGVKVVIATSEPVNDSKAIQFSRAFYESISRKSNIETAFERAKAFVEVDTVGGSDRSLKFKSKKTGSKKLRAEHQKDELLWRMYYREPRHLSWKIDIDIKILINLRLGSEKFLDNLLHGPMIHHQKLIQTQEKDFDDPGLHVMVTLEDETEYNLPDALKRLWELESPHAWLYGGPGAGKTGSVLLLWNRLLHFGKTEKSIPVPLFVDMEEFADGEETYILNFLSKYYLELEGYSEGHEKNAISEVVTHSLEVKHEGGRTVPSVVLFLDGNLNYGTTLYQEIEKLSERPGLQIIITTNNPEIENSMEMGFHELKIKPLEEDEIKEKVKGELQKFRPEIRKLVRSNRLWLSLFYEMHKKILLGIDNESGLREKEYAFIPDFTTQGEFLWNYFEARLFSKTSSIIDPDQKRSSLRFYRFYVRHFIPKLAYKIEKEGIRDLTEEDLLEQINEISRHFYQPWFLRVFPEYRRDFKNFLLQAEDWVAESERLAVVIELCKEFSIFIEGFKTYSINEPGKEFLHLQKVRTYQISNGYFLHFLSATHIWQDIKVSLFKGDLPQTLRENELNKEVRIILGQIDGIHGTSDEHALLKLLERCRGVFDQKAIGKTVWNILHIWNDIKGYYMGLSMVKLDLRGIPLFRLSKELGYEPFFLSSDLSNSLLNYQDIFHKKGGHVVTFVYSEDGNVIITGESDGTIRQWDTEHRICYKIIEGHDAKINAICLTHHAGYIISGSEDGIIKFWDQHTEKCLLEIPGNTDEETESNQEITRHTGPILSLAYHPIPDAPESKFWLVSSAQDNLILLWEIDLAEQASPKPIHVFEFHQDAVKSIDIHVADSGQKTIIAGSWDNTVSIWDGNVGVLSSVMDMHVSRVHCVRFSPDGAYFASGSSDDTVIIWNTENPNHVYRRLKGHTRGIDSLAFKSKEELKLKSKLKSKLDQEAGDEHEEMKSPYYLISAASDDKIVVWDLEKINWSINAANNISKRDIPNWRLPLGYSKEVNCAAFDPKSHQIAYATSDGRLRIWDLEDGKFKEKAILYNIYELHVQGCKFINLHEKSNLFETETAFVVEDDGEKEVTKEMLLRQYGAILNEEDERKWKEIVGKMGG